MMTIQLTKKGQVVAAQLAELLDGPREIRHLRYTQDQLTVNATSLADWTLANDVVMLLGGYWTKGLLEVETPTCEAVARVVAFQLEMAVVVAQEILTLLIADELIDLEPISPSLEQTWSGQVAEVFGSSLRFQIVLALRNGPLSTNQIRQLIGPIHVMTVRYHMESLLGLELVQVERDAKLNEYALDPMVVCVYVQRLERLLLNAPWDPGQKRMLTKNVL